MEHPVRKPTRLKDYDYSRCGVYFLTICTQDKKCCLGKIVGGGVLDAPKVNLSDAGRAVEKRIQEIGKTGYICVENFVVMPNHIHLLVRIDPHDGPSRTPAPTNAAIPHMVSTLKRFVHSDVGVKLFQRSYHDHIIRDERDYLKIWEYIDTNPYRWAEDIFHIPDE